MNIRPLGTNILLKSKKEDTSSDAGFIMPNNPDQDTKIGEVIGVGKIVACEWRRSNEEEEEIENVLFHSELQGIVKSKEK